MEATALFNFRRRETDELSFNKGSSLTVLTYTPEQGWCMAQQDGQEGLIPMNYVRIKPHEWYYGSIKRAKAEEILSRQPHDGAFLIRESESTPGNFSLSVKFGDEVLHYKVLKNDASKYFIGLIKFNSLNQLVDHHRTSSISPTKTIYLRDMVPKVVKVVAVFDFEPLRLRKGDVITVIDKSDQNWWRGECNGQEGLLPASFVKEF